MRRRLVTLCLLAVVALVAAACGDDGNTSSAADKGSSNDADATFAQGMIPHHDQAIEMAEIALDPTVGASRQVRDLATRIKQAQDPEIEMMAGWLDAWGEEMPMDSSGGHDMSSMDDASSMQGMMSAEDMATLRAARGASFNTTWLQMMVRHHQGAIAMAEVVKAEGSDPAVRALADRIIAAQQAEIDEMNTALGK